MLLHITPKHFLVETLFFPVRHIFIPSNSGVKPTQEHQAHKLVVKQYYSCQSKGFHTCEQSRLNAYEENSRIIDAEGHVMIFKRNGEVTVCDILFHRLSRSFF